MRIYLAKVALNALITGCHSYMGICLEKCHFGFYKSSKFWTAHSGAGMQRAAVPYRDFQYAQSSNLYRSVPYTIGGRETYLPLSQC